MEPNRYIVKSHHFSSEQVNIDTNVIGQKAVGLFDIPIELTPPFIVITTSLFAEWLLDSISAEAKLKRVLDDCVADFNDKKIENFIVRSSAVNESFDERGLYESSEGNIHKSQLFHSVVEIWKINKRLAVSNKNGFAIIIQQYIESKLLGHLSNERRLSNSSRKWFFELENSDDKNRIRNFLIKEEIYSLPNYICKDKKILKKTLIQIASFWYNCKYSPIERYHLEWIWDQNRLWIVQNDVESNTDEGSFPGSEWNTHVTAITQTHDLTCFSTVSNTQFNWKKIDCVKTFAKCSLPYGNIYILEDKSLIDDLVAGNIPDNLIRDLNWLLQTPIVIRMDVDSNDNVLLPRTETLFTIDDAVSFLSVTSRAFTSKNKHAKFCFLIHRFIISKSCALAFSKHKSYRVRIDSTWGIVDGLHYYPHDSFEINNQKPIRKEIRCKTEYIDVSNTGEWYPRNSGTKWDWRESLTRSQILTIARYNLTISNYLGKAVTVMYFVDVDPKTGYMSTIPWFYSTDEILDNSDTHLQDVVFYPEKFLVHDNKSFDSLKEKVDAGIKTRVTIKLKLDVNNVRDKSLVESIGAYASNKNIPIELEGSILAHTYYILKKQNAKVRIISTFDYEKKYNKVYNKLVRDKIPENIISKGESVKVKSVPKDLKVSFLKRKAVEEAYELFWENNEKKTLEELADLFEVVRSICKELDLTLEELKEIANIKINEKGGFDKGFFLYETGNPPFISESYTPHQLPLFDKSFEGLTRKKTDISQGIFFIPYVPKVDLNSNRLTGSNKFTRLINNQYVEVVYTTDGIRVKLSDHYRDPNQLNLFNS